MIQKFSPKPQTSTRRHDLAIDSETPIEAPPDDGGGHGGYVCFVCGRSTKLGEPFVCATRLWQVQVYEEGEANKRVIDAVASLQACIPCTLMASQQELAWKDRPRLLDSEIHGYYTFARRLADAVAARLSDTMVDRQFLKEASLMQELGTIRSLRPLVVAGGSNWRGLVRLIQPGQCYGCYQMIDSSLPHMEIEMAVNVPTPDSIKLFDRFAAALYCNPCSSKLFAIDGNGHMDCWIW